MIFDFFPLPVRGSVIKTILHPSHLGSPDRKLYFRNIRTITIEWTVSMVDLCWCEVEEYEYGVNRCGAEHAGKARRGAESRRADSDAA